MRERAGIFGRPAAVIPHNEIDWRGWAIERAIKASAPGEPAETTIERATALLAWVRGAGS